ncbi:DUF6448 family protein [Melioribacteraceae bacterium 4301-Me]|uniref:DUF6448 family protein n=1 Tax=Pyranulibacter aquaticus TaxID=3163344 RepID=UPI00359AD803
MLHKLRFLLILVLVSTIFIFTNTTYAHCDSMEGPVVKAAKKALETNNVNYVLIWVKQEYENEIKTLFEKVKNVRKLNSEAKELADMFFFETLVRLHRMGEGEGYTGLKPVGYKPNEGIEAADIAIDKGSVDEILNRVDKSFHQNVVKYYNDVQSKKNYDVNDVTAGREFVEAYVHFIHYVENLFGENVTNHD